MFPWKKNPRKNGPRKKGPRKNGPRKNILKKLFSVNRMLGNLNDFYIFIDWFHYTHKNMFDGHVTIRHASNCRTLKKSRKVFVFWYFEFWVFVDWNILTFHTQHNARPLPHYFSFPSFGFVVEFWVFTNWSPILRLRVPKYRKILIWQNYCMFTLMLCNLWKPKIRQKNPLSMSKICLYSDVKITVTFI